MNIEESLHATRPHVSLSRKALWLAAMLSLSLIAAACSSSKTATPAAASSAPTPAAASSAPATAAASAGGSTSAAVSSAAAASSAAPHLDPATLTVWTYGPVPDSSAAEMKLAAAFETLHPGVTINYVAQPLTNYFSLVHTANLAHNGPDIESLWTGYYVEQNAPWLTKLNTVIPADTQKNLFELNYSSAGYDVSKGIYIAPLETQYYLGIYNKTIFAKAGIAGPPTSWSELYSDCTALKAIGVTPIQYGSASGTFQVAYTLGYLLAGVLTPEQLSQLYTGALAWNDPAIVQQITMWANLHKMGCTNSDVLTNSNPYAPYSAGKAAMLFDGDWEVASGGLPQNVIDQSGVFGGPFNATSQQNLVGMSGYGYGATSYGKHIAQSQAFLAFIVSPAGQAIVAKGGFVPEATDVPAASVSVNPLHQQLLTTTQSGTTKVYPFIDNILQPAVYSTAQSVLPAVLAGQTSPKSALDEIEQTLKSLPADERTLS